MDKKNWLKELQEILVGSYIEEIKDAGRRGALCDFVIRRDGKRQTFTLFVSDLGYSVENIRDEKGYHLELQDIFEASFDHVSRDHDIDGDNVACFGLFDNPMNRTVGFKCCCGKTYEIGLGAIKISGYAKYFSSIETRKRIAKLLSTDYIGSPESLQNSLDLGWDLEE